PGLKGAIDAGIDLKYNIPFKTGILINEFELNPPGEDRNNEWVEIINATKSRADLDGYTLRAGSDPKGKVYTITGLSLSPGQREVITFPGAFLNNSGSSILSAGESVTLCSPDGKEVDKTPAKKDSANDSRTWQRVADGALDWAFAEGTPWKSNCGGLFGGEMVKAQIIKILKDSAVKIMGEMKSLKSTEDLAKFFKAAIHHAITTGIELLAGCLVEAAIFVSLEITDATSTACGGVRFALFIDSGFVEEGLKYLVGEIEALLLNIENPYGLKPKEVLTDNLYLGVTLYVGIKAPKFLKHIDAFPAVKLAVHFNTNLSALCTLIGHGIGKWKVTAGILIMDCPTPLVPPMMKPNMTLESDLWLLRATFTSV
ncbi:MAG: lamin tail domain-containing protein, partial [Candidatus Methanoplasma sp.]|nr:lamin tail domain-containing protein [Candidatus Methanoplasma sp.]